MADVTQFTGFPLELDPKSLEIKSGDGLEFKRTTRYGKNVKEVVCFPDRIQPDKPVYMMDILDSAPTDIQASLSRYGLTYSLVLLPPLLIGDEYVKTTGHYHPPIPGTRLGYPEVYTQIYGKLLLALQRRSSTDPEKILDFYIFEMTPGFVITIPPNYAHCLINPTGEPALMAGLYGKGFSPDYAMTSKRQGLAYYLLRGENGQVEPCPNSKYPTHPEIQWVNDLEGTVFAPDFPNRPIWTSFLENPASFAFLTEADAALKRYPDWE